MSVSLPAWCRIVRDKNADAIAAFRRRQPVQGPKGAAALFADRLCGEEVEVVAVMLLDAQARVMAMQEVTRGLVNSSLVHPREVFRLAVAMGATALVVAHNHPSGVLTPSSEDKAVTRQLVAAGRLLDIPVHDHLIIGSTPDDYFSFAEAGLL